MDSSQEDCYLTIIIASAAGGEFLFNCLESIIPQISNQRVEVIVVDRCGENTTQRITRDYPQVRVIETESSDMISVPGLRKIAVEEAHAEIVAVIEEHCIASPGWVKSIIVNFNQADAAIGGPVMDNEYHRLRDWVVYFSEYHNYLPPWQSGPRYLLNGVNIAYNRKLIVNHLNLLTEGYWEVVLHPVIAAEGDFRAIPEMQVRHCGPFNYRYYLQQRYLLSRVWGGSQRRKVSQMRRFAYLLLAPIIPFLLLLRITLNVIKSKKYIGKFILSFLPLIPVTISYVWGEWLGYFIGEGDALSRVE